MNVPSIVGVDYPRLDARDKALGSTKYVADLEIPGMVYGKAVFSSVPHGKLLSVDVSDALKVPGVLHVFTSDELADLGSFGPVIPNQPALIKIGERARFVGDAVAIVVAENAKAARQGARLVKANFETLPGLFSVEDAIKPGAVALHENAPNNICASQEFVVGDVVKGFAESDVVVEDTIRTPWQEHAYLETEGALAYIDESDRLVVRSCVQDPYYFAYEIAKALHVPISKVRVVGTPVGGGFGGKDDITLQIFAAAVALKIRRPVKMIFDREESIVSHPKRHPLIAHVKMGARSDGTICAIQADILLDAGPYAGRSPVVLAVCINSFTGPYFVPNIKLTGRAVYTNNFVSGACRGYGQPQSCFAREVMLDKLARALNQSPVELRLKNVLQKGQQPGTRLVNLDSEVSLPKVIAKAVQEVGPEPDNLPSSVKWGWGLACAMPLFDIAAFPSTGLAGTGTAIEMLIDGSVKVYSGAVEMGQGVTTVLAQIAAQELGVDINNVQVVLSDTDSSPKSGPTVASRTTYTAGNSLRQAAEGLKNRLLAVAGEMLECNPQELVLERGEVRHVELPLAKRVSLQQVAKRCYDRGVKLREEGWFSASHALIGHTFMATTAEVAVDTETGEVKVLRMINVDDVGKAINPSSVRGQLNGGAVQAMGWAVLENLQMENGRVLTPSLSEYLVPTVLDIPVDMKSVLVEEAYPTGPYGAKGVGEHSTITAAAAIVNAVSNALGVGFNSIPLTPEKVLAKLKEREKS